MRRLQKWHGAGNDFLIDVAAPNDLGWWDAARAAAACDRHRGIGADGVAVATVEDGVISMTLFNADGSPAEVSGNGARCVVAAVCRATGDRREEHVLRTDAGERTVSLRLSGDDGQGEVSLGPVTIGPPLAGTLGTATVGNPHVVVEDRVEWTTPVREELAREWAGQLGGANVEFVTVVSPDVVRQVVFERGAGWTQACGTGSAAVAAVLHGLGRTGPVLTIHNPGGPLVVTLDGDGARLRGPVRFVADIAWSAP